MASLDAVKTHAEVDRLSIDAVPVDTLHQRLGWPTPLDYPASSLNKPLTHWTMEIDDAPIFRYLYRHAQPNRHLEFGTWLGTGTTYCLEESPATVWTINLPQGEEHPTAGGAAYPASVLAKDDVPDWLRDSEWSKRLGRYPSDSVGLIGLYYLKKNLGHRVCQILCDSRQWDTSQYPPGFFDSVLIDGGHVHDVVVSDTRKALPLVRPGGLIMWHDYCPDEEVQRRCPATQGVAAAITDLHDWLKNELTDLFWIKPSWLLVGIKA